MIIPTPFDTENEQQHDGEILMTLADNGYWEYARTSFGQDEQGLYWVDVDDAGKRHQNKNRIKDGLTLDGILAEGTARGVFEYWPREKSYRINENCDENVMKEFFDDMTI